VHEVEFYFMEKSSTRPKTFAQWLVLVVALIGGLAALVWRLIWPVTGITADLILIGVMLIGIGAAKLAKLF